MEKVFVFLADGFEEIEGLTVVDLLRRAGEDVTTVSIMGRKEDADIDISRLSSSESYEGRGDISLSVSTVSGKVRYDFLGE